jgi:hypothetical protein
LIAAQLNARDLAGWLQHHAFLLTHAAKYDEAVESCRAMVNLGRSMGDEPVIMACLIRIAAQVLAMETLERVLAQGQVSDDELGAMQDALAQEITNEHFLQAIRGERAGMQLLFESIRDGKTHFDEMGSSIKHGDTFSNWCADTRLSTYFPDHLRYMNRGVEMAKLPIHERNAPMEQWSAEIKNGKKNPVTWLLARGLVKVHQADCRSQAMLRSTIVALAAERYRLRHKDKRWPASLDELVKKRLLDTIPNDPMDNQPIRYRRTQDGVVIYSIGIDLADDGGNIDRERPQNLGVDVGIRLWDPSARRQPAQPHVVIPDDE